VLKQSSGIFNNFGAVKPPLRQAAGRYLQANRTTPTNSTLT